VMTSVLNKTVLAMGLIVLAGPALAHSGHGNSFAAGFAHPMSGADHVLAMLAVGLWAAMRGGRAVLAWPVAFVGGMLGGFLLAQADFAIPHLEPMILSTVIMLGAAIAFGLHAPIVAGAAAIALAGLAHGFAHGTEVQGAVMPFAAGFMLASAVLHAAGLGLGLGFERFGAQLPGRLAGGFIMLAGAAIALS
jgi:urease accessory protein